MPDTAFRLYIKDMPATREQLDRIEQIVVRQEMDLIWEAEVTMHTCLNAAGVWQHRTEDIPPFTRVRIELRQGSGEWTALIDGPVASTHTELSAQPSSSEIKFVVRDDSVFLNRNQSAHSYVDKTDSEIIDTVLSEYAGEPDSKTFEKNIAPIPGDIAGSAARRHTPIQFLREIAHERGWHAYVLPGPAFEKPSVFCFQPKSKMPGALPALKLLGDDRTLQTFSVQENPEVQQKTKVGRIDFAGGKIITAQAAPSEEPFMAAFPTVKDEKSASRLADPAKSGRLPADVVAKAETEMSKYVFKASGRLVPGRYPGILAPYQVVQVLAGAAGQSSNYLLKKVTHTLSRNLYTQEFEAIGDSLNLVESSPQAKPAIT